MNLSNITTDLRQAEVWKKHGVGEDSLFVWAVKVWRDEAVVTFAEQLVIFREDASDFNNKEGWAIEGGIIGPALTCEEIDELMDGLGFPGWKFGCSPALAEPYSAWFANHEDDVEEQWGTTIAIAAGNCYEQVLEK